MFLLLLAFSLNLAKRLTQDAVAYIVLNILGAGLSVYYAIALDAVPFIILESVWGLFALYKLMLVLKKRR
ncbi:MAG: hypothetical protein DRP46_12225 [Candidatus Zixiibacteriota bacterium]|nr:MAG: hypothetical protein DRP46_12225 [candidate division Zixibacteria bacterium]HDL03698.1 hypothetical protein [candidate division Zixibacteria bacterium]